ncbi:hypothetical protein E2C01_070792 [Portunus trituberculatus]|uniref:RNase H type-1 domain-containing protein n=1 Tax=Portunus trituberculatus TaxID=210409 RepID=A0A5B7HYA0_PORTR|nr:hypothetical protein [Portunus trituberculatus]
MARHVVGYSDFYHPPVRGQLEEGPAAGQEGLLVHHLHPLHVDEAHGLLDVSSPGDTAGASGGKATGCFRGRPRTVCARFHHTFTGCCVSGSLRAFWRLRFLGGCQRRSSKSTQMLRTAVGASRRLTVDRAGDAGRHVNGRELTVPLLFLQQQADLRQLHICFYMDNEVAVQCVKRMGSSRSISLLRKSKALFNLAALRHLTLSAVHVPGRDNVWANVLSSSDTSSVEWSLNPDVFTNLEELFGLPKLDLFATSENHQLQQYITRSVVMATGGLDSFLMDWNTWGFVYLFPPPAMMVMTAVVCKLETFRGRVLLIAPLWKAQPWCQCLLLWCPSPLPLNRLAVRGHGIRQSGISSSFHAWSFCRRA